MYSCEFYVLHKVRLLGRKDCDHMYREGTPLPVSLRWPLIHLTIHASPPSTRENNLYIHNKSREGKTVVHM